MDSFDSYFDDKDLTATDANYGLPIQETLHLVSLLPSFSTDVSVGNIRTLLE